MAKIHAGELFIGLAYLLVFPIALLCTSIHVYKTYSDLYTKERKSVAGRRIKPKITPLYKKMTLLTTSAIIVYFITVCVGLISANFITIGPGCAVMSGIGGALWVLTKPFTFLVYIVRLHQCYGKSAYGYGKNKLMYIGIFIIFVYGVLFLMGIVGKAIQTETHYQLKDEDGLWPHNCSTGTGPPLSYFIGGGTILFDLIFTIGSIFAFTIPINRLLKQLKCIAAMENATEKLNDKKTKKMLYIGYKYKVCVACASLSSLAWIFLALTGQTVIYLTLASIDWAVNMLCLMLMTPYYPDDKYYQRLCCLCIRCCDYNKQSYQSKASPEKRDKDNNQEPTITGLDNSVVSPNVSSSPGLSNSTDTASNLPSTSPPTLTNGNVQSIDTMDIVQTVAKSNDDF